MTLSAFLDPRGYPTLLPYVGYHHGEIYIHAEPGENIASNEGLFLECCDGTKSLAEIALYCNVAPSFISRVAHLCAWWPDPVTARRPAAPDQFVPRLVLASNPEEPWLGMGGTLLRDADTIATCVLSCFHAAPLLHLPSRTSSEAAMVCADEASVAARLANVALDQLKLPEAAVRRGTEISDDLIRSILRDQISSRAEAFHVREVFVPAGMGHNWDAQLLFEAVLSLISDGLLNCDVHVYSDQPLTRGGRSVDELHARFECSYFALREYIRDIDAQSRRKAALLRVFRHRVAGSRRREWQDDALLSAVRARQKQIQHAERFWELQFTELG